MTPQTQKLADCYGPANAKGLQNMCTRDAYKHGGIQIPDIVGGTIGNAQLAVSNTD